MNRLKQNTILFHRSYFVFILFLFTFITITSCKTTKKIAGNDDKKICLLDYKSPKVLSAQLKNKEFTFDKINTKLSAEVEIDSNSHSFTASMRIRKDSLIWMSISKLGIEGARAMITKDTVKFINRIDQTYFIGDFSYISKLLGSELDFEIIQSLLIGNSVTFYDEDEKLKSGVDNCRYFLGTIRKRKLRRVEKGKELKEPLQSIFLLPTTFKIDRIIFYDFNPDRSLDVHFKDYFKTNDTAQSFPEKITYSLKAQKRVNIEIKYAKVALDEEQSFPFKIPGNYEKMVYKENQ